MEHEAGQRTVTFHSEQKSQEEQGTQIQYPDRHSSCEGLSESLSRTFSRYGVGTTVRPFRTVRNELVHPKDTLNYEEASQCIYEIPCKNCDKVYAGETGRNLGTRLNEHRKEVETKDTQRYTSFLCSFNLVPRFLPVSPAYTLSQFLQGIS